MIKLSDGELLDIMPDGFARQPQVVAISYALKQAYAAFLLASKKAYVYASIDTAPDDVLDYLAVDLHVRYYRQEFTLERKRALIKTAIQVQLRDGTKFAVDTVIREAMGSGESHDWYEYGGEPGYFRIDIDPEDSYDVDELLAILDTVKRESAHLESINLHTDIEQTVYFGTIMQTGINISGQSDVPDFDSFSVLGYARLGMMRLG